MGNGTQFQSKKFSIGSLSSEADKMFKSNYDRAFGKIEEQVQLEAPEVCEPEEVEEVKRCLEIEVSGFKYCKRCGKNAPDAYTECSKASRVPFVLGE